ncbi:MAG: hypothetical protein H6753_00445 [Candidatus Omnitrophica bacterium]|nr:hypothetical protein [Candidatus Omnitrophota bacterium]
MTEQRFSKGEAIRFGWQTMNDNLGFFIVLMLIIFAITGIPSIFASVTEKSMPLVSGLMQLICQFLSIFITPGMLAIYLKFCDGQSARYEDLFAYPHLFFRYLGASILVGLAVIVPALCAGMLISFVVRLASNLQILVLLMVIISILIVIAAVIFSVRLQFFGYFIVDQNMGAIQSIKKSYALTKGLLGQLVLFVLLIVLINLAGMLCLFIGLFATIPATTLAVTYVYRKLTTEPQIVAAPVALSE